MGNNPNAHQEQKVEVARYSCLEYYTALKRGEHNCTPQHREPCSCNVEQKAPKENISMYVKFKLQAKQARTGFSTASLFMLGDCPVYGGMRIDQSQQDDRPCLPTPQAREPCSPRPPSSAHHGPSSLPQGLCPCCVLCLRCLLVQPASTQGFRKALLPSWLSSALTPPM